MIKVKEWADKYMFPAEWNTEPELKKNGHYDVQGHWAYPKNINNIGYDKSKDWSQKDWSKYVTPDQMSFQINNETLIFRMCVVNNKSITKYGYLQTYEDITRTGPDENGYYSRSTDEEIIRYLTEMYEKINKNAIREKKLKRILGL